MDKDESTLAALVHASIWRSEELDEKHMQVLSQRVVVGEWRGALYYDVQRSE